MNTATALTESATVAAAYQIGIFAGRDFNTLSLRDYQISLFGITLATRSGFKTRAAAGRAADKFACKIVSAMLADTAEAGQIVKLAAEASALFQAKKFPAFLAKEARLQALVSATFGDA